MRNLLAQITDAVVSELRPSAVVLHGSFGRGEGGAYKVGRELCLGNDVDLMAVYSGPSSIVKSLNARKRARSLSELLTGGSSVQELDLVTRPAFALRWPPPSLKYFELLRSARVLYGTVKLKFSDAASLDRVPPSDFVGRLLHRGGGLLMAWAWLAAGDADFSELAARTVQQAVDRVFLACGDLWLYRNQQYDHRLATRVERFRVLRTAGPNPSPRLREEYELSVRERLFPSEALKLSRAEHHTRWQVAVEEWLACFKAREGLGLPAREGFLALRSHWHPLRLGLRIIKAVRGYSNGLLSARAQTKVLPLLLAWALDDRDNGARSESIAAVMGAQEDDAYDLPSMVDRFLLAWEPTGEARNAAGQARLLAGHQREPHA